MTARLLLTDRKERTAMSCPNIYLGPNRHTPPLPALYHNAAILVSSADPYRSDQEIQVGVEASNHGTDDSPQSLLELYWSDPTSGFLAFMSRRLIAEDVVVPGATLNPDSTQTDGTVTRSRAWTPGAGPLGTNDGHVCLLARIANNVAPGGGCAQQGFDTSSPATDPRSAIRNIHVVAPPPAAPGGAPGGAGGGMMGFAFAATNTLFDVVETQLMVKALDPKQDREKLQALVAMPDIDKALSCRKLKFGLPRGVLLGEGRERVVVPPRLLRGYEDDDTCPPRLGRLGPMDEAAVKRYTLPQTKPADVDKPRDLPLLPGEMRQMMVQVQPCGHDDMAYAVEVGHQACDGRNIGGLVMVFVPPHDYF